MAKRYPLAMASLVNAHEHWRHRIVTDLIWPNEEGTLSIDDKLINAILPYSEPGEMGPTIWFEVVRSTGSYSRHNGSFVDTVNFVEVPPKERTDSE